MEIDLKVAYSSLAHYYQSGNICAKYYSSNNIPSDQQLESDISEMLKLYNELAFNESLLNDDSENEYINDQFQGHEDLTRIKFHRRIERNAKLVQKVKEFRGYKCEVCNLNFQDTYGSLGAQYIEAHHLRPLSTLTGDKVLLDVRKDFAVLCSNCHRMIHRMEDTSDIELLRNIIWNRDLHQ